MGTEVLKSFGVLQSELDQARSTLKDVDEDIKRLIGRDPAEIFVRQGLKRPPNQGVGGAEREGRVRKEVLEPATKRRDRGSVFSRLSDRPMRREEEQLQQQKHLISKVIVTPKEVPSRQEALAKQSRDERSKARNRRMFGALLGQLQKFQQEETKLKSKEQKRAEVEKKIEETEIREKAEIKKERQELFLNRKKKQAEIKMIELKMLRMKQYSAWEERQRLRQNYILTKAKPHIQFLPRRLNDANKALLDSCRSDIDKLIEKRKEDVNIELQQIEERMKRNFEPKAALAADADKDKTEAVDQNKNDDEEQVNGVNGNDAAADVKIEKDIEVPKTETSESPKRLEDVNEENENRQCGD